MSDRAQAMRAFSTLMEHAGYTVARGDAERAVSRLETEPGAKGRLFALTVPEWKPAKFDRRFKEHREKEDVLMPEDIPEVDDEDLD